MDRETISRVEALCREALELPAGEVAAFLDRACGDDGELRRAAEEYLSRARQTQEMPADRSERRRAAPTDPCVGRQLGPYQLLRRIGAGGMGEVYLAQDTRLHRPVAVKLLPHEWSRDDTARERFETEARAASSLDHPNICTVHDVGASEEGRLFLVMAYYQGETLRHKLARGPLPIAQAVELATQIGRGLERAHEAGIVHRDVKPANVMVTDRGEVKILDFGIAKIAGAVALTRTGALIGTAAYLSPEQARSGPVDARADLWALGALLYEMLSGQPPFGSDNAQAVIAAILTSEPVPLRELRPQVPEALAKVVSRALAKRPSDRQQSAGELVRDLVLLSGSLAPPAARAAEDGPTLLDAPAGPPVPVLRALVATALVEGPRFGDTWDDTRASRAYALFTRHDRAARELLGRWGGIEVDKQDGFLDLFERAADAVGYALAYHRALTRLSEEEGVDLAARVAIHLGQVVPRRNLPAEVARGARALEIEGLAKPTVARLLSLAGARQTLLTRAAFDLARRAAPDDETGAAELRWLAHGPYVFGGADEPLEVFEVGAEGFAPLAAPAGSAEARRQVDVEAEQLLGWRPAPEQPIPHRPNWLLVERLGEGGFGEVWLARHKSGERRVFKFCFEAARLRALKREVTLFRLLKEGLGHRDDIARILDWSFEQPPYFLESEHTLGGTLVDWAARQGGLAAVPLAARLELVAQIATALAAAHSVGILHKDVKPANVLIATDLEGRPRARLTDFGIGLLTEQARLGMEGITDLGFTATDLPTETGSGGTLRYMAPELLDGKPASVQADVYSLGVVLYQMVVGDFSRTLAPGWQRDVDDELLAEDMADLVDGHPERRPASAAEVAERLRTLEQRRAARDEQRRAREQAEAARVAFERMRRRRKAATAVAAAALVVLAAVAVLAYQAVQARREADQRRRQADALVDFMLGDLHGGLESIGRLDLLSKVADKAQQYLADQPDGPESPTTARRRGISLLATADVMLDQGETERAIAGYRAAQAVFADLSQRDPRRSRWQLDLATSHLKLGEALKQGGQPVQALDSYRAALDIGKRLLANDPSDTDARLTMAWARTEIGTYLSNSGRLPEAAASLEAALALTANREPPAQAPWRWWKVVLTGQKSLGNVYSQKQKYAEATPAYQAALAVAERLADKDPTNLNWRSELADCQVRIGTNNANLGRYELAIAAYRSAIETYRTLDSTDPSNQKWRTRLARTLITEGEVQAGKGDPAAALAAFAQAREVLTRLAAQDPSNITPQRYLHLLERNIGNVRKMHGETRLALAAYLTARSMLDKLVQRDPADRNLAYLVAESHAQLGTCYAALGEADKARREWEQILARREALLAAESPWPRSLYVWALLALGRVDEARPIVAGLPADSGLDDEVRELIEKAGLELGKSLDESARDRT